MKTLINFLSVVALALSTGCVQWQNNNLVKKTERRSPDGTVEISSYEDHGRRFVFFGSADHRTDYNSAVDRPTTGYILQSPSYNTFGFTGVVNSPPVYANPMVVRPSVGVIYTHPAPPNWGPRPVPAPALPFSDNKGGPPLPFSQPGHGHGR